MTDPARLFSTGITAASTSEQSSSRKTSLAVLQGATVACGTSVKAASWLKEPSSPWIATRILTSPEFVNVEFNLCRRQPSSALRATYHRYKASTDCKETKTMLWTIFVILLILWLLGFIGFHVLGAYIHILLVIALVVLIFAIIGGRRTVV